jgi:hypothetical protein
MIEIERCSPKHEIPSKPDQAWHGVLPRGRERIRMLRNEGEKAVQDAIMIPDTLITILAAARAAQGLPWLLRGQIVPMGPI